MNFVQIKELCGECYRNFEYIYICMIYTNIPYTTSDCDNNLGCAYNNFIDILPSEND